MEGTIYISGKITGVKDLNRDKFSLAEKKFKDLGYVVINPHKIKLRKGQQSSWKNYMINDIAVLLKYCDKVAVLDDWADSKGATTEIFLAQQFGIEVIYAETLKPFNRKLSLTSSVDLRDG